MPDAMLGLGVQIWSGHLLRKTQKQGPTQTLSWGMMMLATNPGSFALVARPVPGLTKKRGRRRFQAEGIACRAQSV